MISKGVCRAAAAVISMLIAAQEPAVQAQNSDIYEMHVPFSVTDGSGNIPKGTTFEIVMTSTDSAPLPEKTSYIVDVTGEQDFGPIIFDEPGDYEYTIYESACESEDIVSDATVYHIHATVLYDSSGALTGGFALTEEGKPQKPETVEFENKIFDEENSSYPESSSEITPDSSDESSDSTPDDTSSTQDTDTDTSHRTEQTPGNSQRDPEKPSVIETIFSPNTGGGAIMALSGFAIPLAMVVILRRRKADPDDDSPDQTG